MNLPQEILDEILSHLPPDDDLSLHQCSLVSKSWLELSRRRLFSDIRIGEEHHQRWLDKISPANTGLLRHVRSFTYFPELFHHDYPRPGICALRDYLPSLCQLRALTFSDLHIEPTISENLEIFTAFRQTLSSLSFNQVRITWSAFVALIGYFPNLRKLDVQMSWFMVDDSPVPQLSHVLRGTLLVSNYRFIDTEPFIDRLHTLKPEFDELVIIWDYDHRLAAAVGPSLKYLSVDSCRDEATLDLSRFPELRQLAISEVYPRKQERLLISTITSMNFRKVIVGRPEIGCWEVFRPDPCWEPFDDMICGLADRLRKAGLKHTLEVELQVGQVAFSEEEHKKFLPKFKEKGRVRIISTSSDVIQQWP